jgi:hypothetical protein
MVFFLSWFGPGEPWGLWQSEHTTLPTSIGWVEIFLLAALCPCGEADFGCVFVTHLVDRRMHLVAVIAGDGLFGAGCRPVGARLVSCGSSRLPARTLSSVVVEHPAWCPDLL